MAEQVWVNTGFCPPFFSVGCGIGISEIVHAVGQCLIGRSIEAALRRGGDKGQGCGVFIQYMYKCVVTIDQLLALPRRPADTSRRLNGLRGPRMPSAVHRCIVISEA